MKILNELQKAMEKVEKESEHKGYWYRIRRTWSKRVKYGI